MPVEIRQPIEAEVTLLYQVFATALQVATLTPEAIETRRPGWHLDRAVTAWDGDDLVGTAGVLPFHTRLPGGADVATAGLTRVGVLASHRRRGVLTSLMQRHLEDALERGEPLASLRASEAPIYGRFGYGLAGVAVDLTIDVRRSAFRREPRVGGRFRVLQGPEAGDILPAVYERSRRRTGMLRRDAWVWLRIVQDLVKPDGTSTWVVVHEDARGRPDGYAIWSAVERDQWKSKGHRIEVEDLHGVDDEVVLALWRFVLDLDLVEHVQGEGRPLDDPLRQILVDLRAYETKSLWDEQWVRLVDVAGVLGARTYEGDAAVVIEVTEDRQLPHNVGRYEVSGAGCRRVRRAADLRCDVATLGALSLGGTGWYELVIAGRVHEARRGAAARADRLFAERPLPWCGTFF